MTFCLTSQAICVSDWWTVTSYGVFAHALQQTGNCWVLNMLSHTNRCSEKLCSLVNHWVVTKLSAHTLTRQSCHGPILNSVLMRSSLRHTHRPSPYHTNQFATQYQCRWECVSTILCSVGWSSQRRKMSGDNLARIWDKVVSKARADSAGNTHRRLSIRRIVAEQWNLSVHDHLQVSAGKTSFTWMICDQTTLSHTWHIHYESSSRAGPWSAISRFMSEHRGVIV